MSGPLPGPGPDPVPLYPVSLRVEGLPCLVVGGGAEALARAEGLLAAGADVTVVTSEPSPDLVRRAAGEPRLTLALRPYRAREAGGYRLVLAASGDQATDRAVATDAEAAGVWANAADDPPACAFYLPAVHRDGPVTVAVSTGGSSPALASWLRSRAARELGPGLGTLAGLLAGARRRCRAEGRPTASLDWAGLLDGPLPGLVREGRLEEAGALVNRFIDDGP